jgi:hypothetical protein
VFVEGLEESLKDLMLNSQSWDADPELEQRAFTVVCFLQWFFKLLHPVISNSKFILEIQYVYPQIWSSSHIRALTESFNSKLAVAGNPLVRQLGRHLRRPRVDWSPPGNRGELTCSGPAEAVPQKTAKSAQRVVLSLLGTPTEVFRAFPQL